jgi:hypothetical protein
LARESTIAAERISPSASGGARQTVVYRRGFRRDACTLQAKRGVAVLIDQHIMGATRSA